MKPRRQRDRIDPVVRQGRAWWQRWPAWVLLGVAMAAWYAVLPLLLAHEAVSFDPFRPALLGMAFNSMAAHLLAGRFDIDPAAIDFEAFIVDGRSVSYFGIFCGLLRLPLVLFDALDTVDITRLSCLAALCLGAWFQVLAVMTVHAACPPSPLRTWLTAAMLAVILLGGQQIQFARPSIYQEVLDWANAEAMGFVFLAVRGLVASGSSVPAPGWGISRRRKPDDARLFPGRGSGGTAGADSVPGPGTAPMETSSGVASGTGAQPGMVVSALAQAIHGFGRGTLCGMAVFAGLALLTRVSFGVGLYAALALLMLVNAWKDWPAPMAQRQTARMRKPAVKGGTLMRMSVHAQPDRAPAGAIQNFHGWPRWLLIPGLILLAFAVAAGVVNHGRWGNPLTFADFSLYSMSLDAAPDRLGRLAAYGAFNPERIWFGLAYYFLPIWGLLRDDGQLLFMEAQTRLMDSVELPPGSFLLSDPLLLGLCMAAVASVRRAQPLALLAGLAVPPILMLCAISMSYRYRMEFYPLLVLGALVGFHHLCRAPNAGPVSRRIRIVLILAVLASTGVSHGMAALYAASPWGPADQYLIRAGWAGTYGLAPSTTAP